MIYFLEKLAINFSTSASDKVVLINPNLQYADGYTTAYRNRSRRDKAIKALL